MRTKVLSGIVIVVMFLALMGLAVSILPSEISGFWGYLGISINALFISSGTVLGALFTTKWFIK